VARSAPGRGESDLEKIRRRSGLCAASLRVRAQEPAASRWPSTGQGSEARLSVWAGEAPPRGFRRRTIGPLRGLFFLGMTAPNCGTWQLTHLRRSEAYTPVSTLPGRRGFSPDFSGAGLGQDDAASPRGINHEQALGGPRHASSPATVARSCAWPSLRCQQAIFDAVQRVHRSSAREVSTDRCWPLALSGLRAHPRRHRHAQQPRDAP
jgi:hypothetical protein